MARRPPTSGLVVSCLIRLPYWYQPVNYLISSESVGGWFGPASLVSGSSGNRWTNTAVIRSERTHYGPK